MCGIAGFASNSSMPFNASGCLPFLSHRGPNGNGEITINVGDSVVWLGHTRLSILDLSLAGHQPMSSRDGRWWLTFNGEIYNHLKLRSNLDGPFRGHSDTETLVEAAAFWGLANTLPMLNGMFAFCAVDTLDRALYLVRDPFGIKPLYYSFLENGGIVFASEARALTNLAGLSIKIDPDALQTFLTLRYVPSPRTLWKGVYRLPPGHYLRMKVGTWDMELIPYGNTPAERFVGKIDDAVAAYQEVLANAVCRQLISDVPVGLLLSGGIDSALVAALAKEAGYVLPSFTVGFSGEHYECEIEDAAYTARVLGLPHVAVKVTPAELWDSLELVVSAVEEPLGTTSVLPMWHLVQKAREDVTVVLTGQGSDEPWGGYTRYQAEIVREWLPFPNLLKGLDFIRHWKGTSESAERALRSIPLHETARRFEETYMMFTSEERMALTGRSDDGGALSEINSWIDKARFSSLEPVELMMWIDSRMNLADDLLLYGDKISMRFSLEARVPMLDIEVVRFIESLPRAYRIGLGKGKVVHKKMAEAYLPPEIVYRKKKGFQVPFGKWSRGEWRDKIESTILDVSAPHWDLLDRRAVELIWRDHIKGRDRSRKVFTLLILALWWRFQGGSN